MESAESAHDERGGWNEMRREYGTHAGYRNRVAYGCGFAQGIQRHIQSAGEYLQKKSGSCSALVIH